MQHNKKPSCFSLIGKIIRYINKNRGKFRQLKQFICFFSSFICAGQSSTARLKRSEEARQDTSGALHLARGFRKFLHLTFFLLPSSLFFFSFFFTLSQSRALRHDLDSLAGNVFPFSHNAPGGDVAHRLALSERLLAFLPWGEKGRLRRGGAFGLTEEMSLYLSLCHTNKRPGH